MRIVSFALAATILTVSLAFSQDMGSNGGMGHGGMMMDSGKGMGGGGCGMIGMLMPRVVASTQDGIIVQSGNRLLRYDKNLALKNQVVVPIDTAGIQAMMQQMNCPMMMNRPQGGQPSPQTPSQQPQQR